MPFITNVPIANAFAEMHTMMTAHAGWSVIEATDINIVATRLVDNMVIRFLRHSGTHPSVHITSGTAYTGGLLENMPATSSTFRGTLTATGNTVVLTAETAFFGSSTYPACFCDTVNRLSNYTGNLVLRAASSNNATIFGGTIGNVGTSPNLWIYAVSGAWDVESHLVWINDRPPEYAMATKKFPIILTTNDVTTPANQRPVATFKNYFNMHTTHYGYVVGDVIDHAGSQFLVVGDNTVVRLA